MKRGEFTMRWWWVVWALVVGILLWIILIAAIAKIAHAYELDVADKRVPLPAVDWRYLQQQCDAFPEKTYGQVGCAFEWEAYVPHGMGPAAYWHETGHLFDFSRLTDAQHAEFERIMGIPAGTPWFSGGPGGNGSFSRYHPPGELFADAYSLCALRATGRPWAGITEFKVLARGRKVPLEVQGYGYPYAARWKQHMRVCQLIANSAGEHYDWKTGAFR